MGFWGVHLKITKIVFPTCSTTVCLEKIVPFVKQGLQHITIAKLISFFFLRKLISLPLLHLLKPNSLNA